MDWKTWNHLNTILKEKNNPHLGKIGERVTATVPALGCPETKKNGDEVFPLNIITMQRPTSQNLERKKRKTWLPSLLDPQSEAKNANHRLHLACHHFSRLFSTRRRRSCRGGSLQPGSHQRGQTWRWKRGIFETWYRMSFVPKPGEVANRREDILVIGVGLECFEVLVVGAEG